MTSPSDRHKDAYREEAVELLNELEESLLELEENPSDSTIIGRVFRALHTVKGSGSMFGYNNIAAFTHDVENTYELIRSGRLDASKEIIDLTLLARDHIRILLEADDTLSPEEAVEGERIIDSIKALLPKDALTGDALPEDALAMEGQPEGDGEDLVTGRTYRIIFSPHRDIFLKGINPAHLLEDLSALGRTYVLAHMDNIPSLEDMDPEGCYVSWDVLLTTPRPEQDVRDVFMFLDDGADITISLIDDTGQIAVESDYKKLGEILVEKGDISQKDIESIVSDRKLLGEMLVEEGLVPGSAVDSALMEQQFVKDARKQRRSLDQASTVRVPSEKLDSLVNLVSEMVTTQARLTQITHGRRDAVLTSISEEVERLTAELHDSAMNIRMVPIGSTFSKFRRLVRDLSKELGRNVNLVMEGAETELDKTVIDRLNDPMVHLIRNSLDHGIEPPDVRGSAGKHAQGTIKIAALHSGADVLVKVQDDGAGIDTKAVARKAMDLGLITPDDEVSDQDLFGLIFQPGFSTARNVSSVSGRGVGMDVVRQSVEGLRGSVECTSRKGLGSTITLRIPLTLAIIEGLLVKVEDAFFVMPLATVEECVELQSSRQLEDHGRSLVNVRGELIPYIKLREKFSVSGTRPPLEQIVIIKVDNKKVGLAVDQVVGEHQTVIKSLSRVYKDLRAISGATILGDGTVALILDLPRLLEDAELSEAIATGRETTNQPGKA